MNTRHAVLLPTSMLWIEGKGFVKTALPELPRSVLDMSRLAYEHRVTHLWTMPGGQKVDQPPKSQGDYSFTTSLHRRTGQMINVSAWKRGIGHNVNVVFPESTSWWGIEKHPGWLQQCDPQEVLITLRYLEQSLGVTVGCSPGRAGWDFLKTLHPEWVEVIPGIDLRGCHFVSGSAPDIIHQRPLLSIERRKKFIHKFDKNAAYPYAGTQTDVGVGTPVHVDHGDDAIHEKGHPQSVGVWRCTVNGDATPLNMPPIWEKREGWLAGPIIRLLRQQGAELTVHEGWVFPERHDTLVNWGKKLWDVRQGFSGSADKWVNKKCANLAYQATKQIMNATIGLTAFKKFDDGEEMKRPDIRVQAIARHRELTWHNINKIRTLHNVTPVIVYMDAVYYLSDEPDGRKFLPELVKRETEMGGYKYEGRIAMTPELLEMFDTKMGENDRLEILNKIGWVK